MLIISPVDNLAEVPLLLKAGADELYGGYVPQAWVERYGLLASLNQRTFAAAQIATEADLRDIIGMAHDQGRTFALTLNAPFYNDQQVPILIDYVARMVELGIDSLILADLGLLRALRRQHPDLEYHASTLAHLSNAGAVRFYASQGICRAILPRHLTVSEMTDVVRAVPGVRFDAFLLVGKCPNTEGLCTFHHVNPERIWPCEVPYAISPLTQPPSTVLQQAMKRQGSWSTTDRRHGCGLCAIPYLRMAGIHGLKLVGRGAPGIQKARNISMTRRFVQLAEQETDFSVYQREAIAAHRERFGTCCHPNICYYPEFFPGGET